MLGRLTSTVSSIIPPLWYLPSGVTFAKTEVSFPSTGQAISPGPLFFPNRPSIMLTGRFFPDPARYSIIHDIYQHPGPTAEVSSVPEQGYLILSVEYRFRHPESPYSSPQLSPVDSLSSAEGSLPSPSSFTGVSCLFCSIANAPYLRLLVRILRQLLACATA